jgi:hypothetical protein
VALTGSWQHLDFEDALGFDGEIIENQDRDRDRTNLSLRVGYQFKGNAQAWASYAANSTSYDQPIDRNGYARDGDGFQAGAGLAFLVTGKIDASIGAMYNERSYDDPSLPDASGWGGTGSLTWRATSLTTLTGSMSSSIEETTNQYSSGFLRNLYVLRGDHELTRSIQLNGFVSYSNNKYEMLPNAPEIARSRDQVYRGGIGLNWFINRWMFLNASYDYEKLKSNVPDDGYEVNRVWLTLGFER